MIAQHADAILATAGFFFFGFLLATVWEHRQQRATTVPLSTSLPSAAGLVVIAAVCVSLGLWLAALSTSLTAALWGIIVGQRVMYDDLVPLDLEGIFDSIPEQPDDTGQSAEPGYRPALPPTVPPERPMVTKSFPPRPPEPPDLPRPTALPPPGPTGAEGVPPRPQGW